MKVARKNGTKKRRGRPATGQGIQVGARWPENTVEAIDAWAAKQGDQPGRSEAIRRLVELGLAVKVNKPKQAPAQRAARAKELAAKTIDSLTVGAPSNDEKATRKRRLLKGPEEFRDDRVDLPEAKAK